MAPFRIGHNDASNRPRSHGPARPSINRAAPLSTSLSCTLDLSPSLLRSLSRSLPPQLRPPVSIAPSPCSDTHFANLHLFLRVLLPFPFASDFATHFVDSGSTPSSTASFLRAGAIEIPLLSFLYDTPPRAVSQVPLGLREAVQLGRVPESGTREVWRTEDGGTGKGTRQTQDNVAFLGATDGSRVTLQDTEALTGLSARSMPGDPSLRLNDGEADMNLGENLAGGDDNVYQASRWDAALPLVVPGTGRQGGGASSCRGT
ncbi:hypothetical protein DL770_011807 [Monosporascus sp. CRB-9-2]|nr:hypothetical protein DL770_011807 [Monosporascus sp. CRB-9-2]